MSIETGDEYISNKETTGEDASTSKAWTVMVYMAGDNNLNEECIWAVSEMERVELKDGLALTVQFDTSGNKAVRRDLTKGAEECRKRIDFVPSHRRAHSQGKSPWAALKDFVEDSVGKYPAGKYMLVLAGHGSGAVGDFLLKQDNPPSYLSVPFLGAALSKEIQTIIGGAKIDILGLDACGMNMVEVGHRIRESVEYLIGAEAVEPNTGWPYCEVLSFLNDNLDIDAEDFACKIVSIYTNYYAPYQDAQVSVNLSACRLSKAEKLKEAVYGLAVLLLKEIQDEATRDAIILAHWRAQSFLFENYVDLWDFCDLLERGCKNKEIQDACKQIKRVVSNEADQDGNLYGEEYEQDKFVLKSCYSGAAFQHSHGTSIYFPWVRDNQAFKRYHKLPFSFETQWLEFIESYVDITQREPRGSRTGKPESSGANAINEAPASGSVRVSQPENRVNEVDVRVSQPENRVNDSEARVSQPENRVNAIETRVSQPTNRLHDDETRVSQPENRVNEVDVRVSQPENRINDSETRVSQPENRVNNVETRVSQPENRVSESDEEFDNRVFDLENKGDFRVSQDTNKGQSFLIPKIKNPPTRYANMICECVKKSR